MNPSGYAITCPKCRHCGDVTDFEQGPSSAFGWAGLGLFVLTVFSLGLIVGVNL